MKVSFLDFESSIAELEEKIEQLRYMQDDSALDIADEISRLSKKSEALTKDVYSKLTPWQISQVSRHPQRPYTLDYIEALFTDFEELHGDRSFADDKAIVGRSGAFQRPERDGDRPSEGPRHQGKDHAQFRHAAPGRLSQGDAADAHGGKVQHPDHDLHRHAGRLSRGRVRKSAGSPRRSGATSTR